MRINKVKYERLKKHSTESFENERVGVEIDVEEGDDPLSAFAMAKAFVNRKCLGEGLKIEEAQEELDGLQAMGVSHDVVERVAKELREQIADGPAAGVSLFPSVHQIGTRPHNERPVDD